MDSLEDTYFIQKELPLLLEFQASFSDSDTLCSSCSSFEFSTNFDQEMDNQLEKFSFESSESSKKAGKKRGRKPRRPQNRPNRMVETIEKYWVRSFRKYIKLHLDKIKFVFNEREMQFWGAFVSKSTKNSKNSQFSTENQEFKTHLHEEKSFGMVFKAWFVEYGEEELSKKFQKNSDMWFIYYEYAIIEIARDGKGLESVRNALKGETLCEKEDSRLYFQIINKNKSQYPLLHNSNDLKPRPYSQISSFNQFTESNIINTSN